MDPEGEGNVDNDRRKFASLLQSILRTSGQKLN